MADVFQRLDDETHANRDFEMRLAGNRGRVGLFKRGLVGSFHQVSRKHLDRYLDEFEFRYNNRKNKYLFRDTLMRLVRAEAMPYEELTA